MDNQDIPPGDRRPESVSTKHDFMEENEMHTKFTNPTKVVTGRNCIMSYLNVNSPRVPPGGGSPKYSVCVIVPKSDIATMEKIRSAIRAAYEAGKEKLRDKDGSIPALKDLKLPIRDGDRERGGDQAYQNAWFFNAWSRTKPRCVDKDLKDIQKTSELYSGIIGRVSVNFFAYKNDNCGISCGLNNLQKLADGRPLGTRSTPEEDFADDGGDESYPGLT